jgi:ribosomal protein L12E/L44/L45/RPP1/RPP2
MKSKLLCIVPVMIGLATPALANDPPAHDEKHEKEKKAKKEGDKKDEHEEHGKDGKKDDKKEHPHQ